jgi:hypothetical protein
LKALLTGRKLANDEEEVKVYFNLNFFLKKKLMLVKFDLQKRYVSNAAARGGSRKISWRRREAG